MSLAISPTLKNLYATIGAAQVKSHWLVGPYLTVKPSLETLAEELARCYEAGREGDRDWSKHEIQVLKACAVGLGALDRRMEVLWKNYSSIHPRRVWHCLKRPEKSPLQPLWSALRTYRQAYYTRLFEKLGPVDRMQRNLNDAQSQMREKRAAGGFEVRYSRMEGRSEKLRNGWKWACSASRGPRSSMEDAWNVGNFYLHHENHSQYIPYVGVFDGHGGAGVSRLLAEGFRQRLARELDAVPLTEAGIYQGMKEACRSFNEELGDYDLEGSTATFSFVIGEYLYVGNVGDSRQVLINGSEVLQLTEDQRPSLPRYAKKVLKERGCVVTSGGQLIKDVQDFAILQDQALPGPSRVGGVLGVARAFGDKGVKGVVANPKVTRVPLSSLQSPCFLLLASDGLSDVASSEELGQVVQSMHAQNFPLGRMVRTLVKSAIRGGTFDNVTALLVRLK